MNVINKEEQAIVSGEMGGQEDKNMDATKNAVLKLTYLEPKSSSGIIRVFIRLTDWIKDKLLLGNYLVGHAHKTPSRTRGKYIRLKGFFNFNHEHLSRHPCRNNTTNVVIC